MADKTFMWDIDISSSETTTCTVDITKFGDGYEQVSSVGINNSRKSWQCSKTDTKQEIDDIYQFLWATRGITPFYFQPILSEPRFSVRLDGQIIRQKKAAKIWQISFNLVQVF